jgi:serine protease Do
MSRVYIGITFLVLGGLGGAFLAEPILHGQNGQANAPAATGIPKEMTSYRDVVKRVLPAVVAIDSTVKTKTARSDEFRRFMDQFPESSFDDGNSGPSHSFGSGFIIDPKGVILTNHHVVSGADKVEITVGDHKFVSQDIRSDELTDLAIIRVKSDVALPYLELGDSSLMEQGDRVLAVGAPFGLTGSVTAGIISAKGRSLRKGPGGNDDYLQTDAAINPGNSGGPLISLDGKVIGITSAIKSRTGGFQGVGLAISSNLVKRISDQLLKEGTVHRGYLGVAMKDLVDKEIASRLGVRQEGGVVISRAYDGSPAAKAGIKGGDVITALAGRQVKDGEMLQGIVNSLSVGTSADAVVVRDGAPQKIAVKIEQMPKSYGREAPKSPLVPRPDGSAITINSIGAQVMDVDEDLAKKMGLKEVTEGAVVLGLKQGSPAFEAKLFAGLVITKADKKDIKSASDLEEALKGGALKKGVLLRGESSAGGTVYALVKSSDAASN